LVVKPSLAVTNRIINGVALQTITGSGLMPGSPVVDTFLILGGDTTPSHITLGTVGADGAFSLVDAGTSCNFIPSSTGSAVSETLIFVMNPNTVRRRRFSQWIVFRYPSLYQRLICSSLCSLLRQNLCQARRHRGNRTGFIRVTNCRYCHNLPAEERSRLYR